MAVGNFVTELSKPSAMKNKLIYVLLIIGLIIILISSCTYMSRYVFLNFPNAHDYKKMPLRKIQKDSSTRFLFFRKENFEAGTLMPLQFGSDDVNDLERFLEDSKTTAFIIIRNDTLLFEKYFNGHNRMTPCKTFSITKNVISALIGIAIDEGAITSVNDPIIKYIPELDDRRLAGVTIQDCLSLTSGINSDGGEIWPWNDKVRIYYSTDIRKFLYKSGFREEPGKNFRIEEISPCLLGLVLERATGTTVSAYLESRIWKKLGMEGDAFWVIDSHRKGFEAINSGFVAVPMDMARFARMYLAKGKCFGKYIISDTWAHNSTRPDTLSLSFWKNILAYNGSNVYFNDMWWGLSRNDSIYEFSANGHFGQRIYIVPYKDLMILRFGNSGGGIDWTAFMQALAYRL